IELLHNAGAEFPGDPEMSALEELARQSQTRAAEAEQFFKQGQELCGERRFEEAIEVLRRAFAMDERNNVIRTFLLETLLEQARASMDTDWLTSENLGRQALELDGDHSLCRAERG